MSEPTAIVGSMQQNATECNIQKKVNADGCVLGLSDVQQRVLELLLQGCSDAEAARQTGVNRVTIYRWRLYDANFRGELSRQRRQLWLQSQQRVRALIPPALEAIEEFLTSPDPRLRFRAASLLLRYVGSRQLAPLSKRCERSLESDEIIDAVDCSELDAAELGDPIRPMSDQCRELVATFMQGKSPRMGNRG